MTPKEKAEALDSVIDAARDLKRVVLAGSGDVRFLEEQLSEAMDELWV